MSILEDVPINDKLRNLGVTEFVRTGDLVQIIVGEQSCLVSIYIKKTFNRQWIDSENLH